MEEKRNEEQHQAQNPQEKPTVVHKFDSSKSSLGRGAVILFIVMLLLGIGTGYVIASKKSSFSVTQNGSSNGNVSSSSIKSGQIFGSQDTSTFKDTAEGTLQNGGMDGEGAYHLVRPGGVSQYVYLTSSVIDLSQFVGRKVKIWGQTQASQNVGWLMDVGRLQVE